MLESDNESTTHASSEIFGSLAHTIQFHDPKRLLGQEIAKGIGGHGNTAWDMYLFYPSGRLWGEEPAEPAEWLHQLRDGAWAGPTRFRWGEALAPALREATDRLLGEFEAERSRPTGCEETREGDTNGPQD